MEQFFDIHKVSKPSSVDNTVKFKDEITIISTPPSFKNITPVNNEQISTEPKILSTLNNSEPITSTLPKTNISNVQSVQPTNNKILSTMPTLNEPTVFNNKNIIIPQTAFNSKTVYFGNGDIPITGISPIDVSNNVISLNNSNVVAGVYTVAEITVDEKGIIQDISSGFIPPNDDWSFFPALGNVDMDNNLIKNLGTPVDNNDATTKNYVDTEIITLSNDISGSYVNLLTEQDISGVKTFLNTPVCANLPLNNNELSNKQYIDTEIITLSNDISGGYVNLLTAQDISGVKTFLNTPVCANLPINNNELSNKQYVDSAVSGAVGAYLPLSGGTMAGNIDMSGNDLNNIGSITAGGVTESATFGQALLPMASVNVYGTNVSMNSYNPISAMNFVGVGGVNINAPDNDINLNAGDINLTQTQLTSFMNLTAVGGIVLGAGAGVDITGGGAVAINAGTYINMTCPGNISIGSANVAGADTEIEKVGFLDNTIYKAGTNDLSISDVALIKNDNANLQLNCTGGNIILSTSNVTTNVSNTVQTIVDGDGFHINGEPTIGTKPTLIFQNLNTGDTQKIVYDASDMNILGDATNLNIINTYTKIKGNGGLLVGGGGTVDGIINIANRDETWSSSIAFNDTDKSLNINNENAINIVSLSSTGNTAQISSWADNGGIGSIAIFTDAPSGHSEYTMDTNGNVNTTASSVITTIPNETVVKIENGGRMSIDNQGLTSGNDPIFKLIDVNGIIGEFRQSASTGLTINTGQSCSITGDVDLNLYASTGTINLSAPTAGIICDGILTPNIGIADQSASVGTEGQVLTSTGAGLIWDNLPIVWGSFSRATTQTVAGVNTTTLASYSTTDIPPIGCSRFGSRINILRSCGKLRIQSSLVTSTGTPTTTFRFWLKKNGVNVVNSTSIVSIKASGDKVLTVCEWFDSCNANDYYEVAFYADEATASIYGDAGGGAPPNDVPACPSIITTVMGFA